MSYNNGSGFGFPEGSFDRYGEFVGYAKDERTPEQLAKDATRNRELDTRPPFHASTRYDVLKGEHAGKQVLGPPGLTAKRRRATMENLDLIGTGRRVYVDTRELGNETPL